MILTDEERERIARPFVRTIGGDHWHSGDDGIRDDGDIEMFAAAIERAVLRKLRERPADAWLLTYDNGERELRFQNNGWPAKEAPLHIIPKEANE